MKLYFVCGLLLFGVGNVAARTIMEAMSTRYDIISFTSLVRRAGLQSLLTTGNYTIFVPTDSALETLPADMISQLYQNITQLKAMVNYHIVPYAEITEREWTGEKVNTLTSQPVRLATYPHNNVTVVNGEVLQESNMTVSNGNIYLLSSILSPPTADVVRTLEQDAKYSKFLTAAALSGMTSKLKEDNITVLAPNDVAFDKMYKNRTDALFSSLQMMQAMVEFHVVPGTYYTSGFYEEEKIRDDNTKYDNKLIVHEYGRQSFRIAPFEGNILNEDWLATNGVIHAISGVKVSRAYLRGLDAIIG
ncbi:transforming growth factor-beta-induced protein ig-h3-like [Haliotis rubra]|uniref:transforming growth factor-beta-induced protein ig-h3-like n=1 Tax=Haliotis rubra TaxID=36100 RepID=UPI001EE5B6ED|nr:transforming growth factor-beta-induced protein ig-h3-like [Haliotis rubra]